MTLGAPAQANSPQYCSKALMEATSMMVTILDGGDVLPTVDRLLAEGYSNEDIGDLMALGYEVIQLINDGYTADEINRMWMKVCVQ